jgi:ATP-binding cassette subfamily B protein
MNPDVLILDEASAALDAETEKRIQQSLFGGGNGSSGKKRLTLAVAHRLATIRNADEIISMVDGAIVERGTHAELLSNKSVYASQWAIQTGEIDVED